MRSLVHRLGALLAAAAALLTLAATVPASAAASTFQPDTTLPYAPVSSLTVRPAGFAVDAARAEAVAKATATMQGLHRRLHPLVVTPFVFSGREWAIEFAYGPRIVAEALISSRGGILHVYTGPEASTPYTRGHYAPIFDSPWVVIPFALAFLIPFLDVRRWRRPVHLDALAVLSLLGSYWLFDHAHLEAAVWLAYLPLLYLLVRMTIVGLRGRRAAAGGRGPDRRLPLRALGLGLVALIAARSALSLVDHKVIDVGYASVIGAYRVAHGQSLYYFSIAHPDTYGPIAYLAYLPFELVFPWHGRWDYLPAAHAASLFFDLATIGGLVLFGRRIRPGREGLRLGVILAWAWAACPFTLLALMEHTNDGLVAMLVVFGLLAFSSAPARGAWLGLAAAAKFSPAALLPLFAVGRRWRRREAALCVGAFLAVVAAAVLLYLPRGGLHEFYEHTLGFQLHRIDVFSPWALHPGLGPVQTALEVLAVLFIVGCAAVPGERTVIQVAALAGAATIAVQLPAVHWFYYYVVWFMPLLIVAALAPAPEPLPATAPLHSEPEAPLSKPLLVGV